MRLRYPNISENNVLPIEAVKINLKSRDDFPPLLYSLQCIYKSSSVCEELFSVLETHLYSTTKKTGSYGMPLWQVFVLGVARTGLNIDYDRLEDLANNHMAFRGLLGVGGTEKVFALQTIKDNVALLDEALLKKLNVFFVKVGHSLYKKKGPKGKGNLPLGS